MDYNRNDQNKNEEKKQTDISWDEEQFKAYAPKQASQNSYHQGTYQGIPEQEQPHQETSYQETSYQEPSRQETPQQDPYGYQNYYYQGNPWQEMPRKEAPQPKPKKKRRALKWIAGTLAVVLLIAASAGAGVYVGSYLVKQDWIQAQQGQTWEMEEYADLEQTADGDLQISQGEGTEGTGIIGNTVTAGQVEYVASITDVSAVVANAMPSIVAINCTAEYVTNFWGQQYTQQSSGSGSGIIIGQNDTEVLIVTNNHVVDTDSSAKNATIEVIFGDDTMALATIKGTEEGSDLAVVSVKLEDLTDETLDYIKIASLGDSDQLKVGEMAIAIGNALGYGQSTTVGWISALEREIASEDYTMSLIQTDAAINPGNSGGALLNIKGEVIGINSAKYSDESIEGMGFAIPISNAIPIINDLMSRELIPEEEQAYLGIVGQDVTEAYHEYYGMPIGVYVYQVSQGSPAAAAGLKMGDIITAFNNRQIATMTDLQSILATYRAGEEITLTIQVYVEGNYEERTLQVTLGQKNR